MALVNSIFLAGCVSSRGPSRLARLQETPAVEPAIQSWESVAFIPVVSSVEVEMTTGETLNGRFRSADERELVLDQDGSLRRTASSGDSARDSVSRTPCGSRLSVGTRYRRRHGICHRFEFEPTRL